MRTVLIFVILVCFVLGWANAAYPACLKLVELGDEVLARQHCSSSTGTTTNTGTRTGTSTSSGHTTHHSSRCTPYYFIDAEVMVYLQQEDGSCSSSGTLGTLIYIKDRDEYTLEEVNKFKSNVRSIFGPIIGMADNTTTSTSDFGKDENGEIRIFDRSGGDYYMRKSTTAEKIMGIIIGVVVGVIFCVAITIFIAVCLVILFMMAKSMN